MNRDPDMVITCQEARDIDRKNDNTSWMYRVINVDGKPCDHISTIELMGNGNQRRWWRYYSCGYPYEVQEDKISIWYTDEYRYLLALEEIRSMLDWTPETEPVTVSDLTSKLRRVVNNALND